MSRLEDMSVEFRKNNLKSNTFKNTTPYGNSHSRALSDGDEFGKGELNNSVGGVTDIKTRETLMTKNKYNVNDPYDDSNA